MEEKNEKLLTIAIPTYNRAKRLNLCLNQINKQISGYEKYLKLIVSNNASSDDTDKIVLKFQKRGLKIDYIKNHKNLGMDKNFIQCFNRTTTKFLLILSDDEVLLESSLEKIIKIIKYVQDKECGVIYLNGYGYSKNFILERPRQRNARIILYEDLYKFIKRVNYSFTLISANIINKELFNKNIKIDNLFIGSTLSATVLTFSSLFNSEFNIYIEEFVIARKRANTGGIKFCEVYGRNLDLIFQYFVKRGVDNKFFEIIKFKLLLKFFPFFLYKLRTEVATGYYYLQEDYYEELYPEFRQYLLFWLIVVPIIKLPKFFLNIYKPIIKITDIAIAKGLIQ